MTSLTQSCDYVIYYSFSQSLIPFDTPFWQAKGRRKCSGLQYTPEAMAERRKKRANLYDEPMLYKRGEDDDNRMWFNSVEEADKELQGPIARGHFGGGSASGVLWIKKERAKKPNSDGILWNLVVET